MLSREYTVGILFATATVAVLIGFIVFYCREAQRKKALYQKLAQKRNGTVTNYLFSPAFHFTHKNQACLVYFSAGKENTNIFNNSNDNNFGHPSGTYFTAASTQQRNYQLIIYRKSVLAQHAKRLGIPNIRSIETFNPDFNKAFSTNGSDEDVMRNFLTLSIQERILKYKNLYPILTVEKDKFSFTIATHLRSETEYNVFIDTAIFFLDEANRIA